MEMNRRPQRRAAGSLEGNGLGRPKAWISWSTGKDSAWALYTVRERGDVEVVALLTPVNTAHARAVITCVDPNKLGRAFAGRTFDAELLGQLPGGVDPCGENGEFHTYAFEGPMFRKPIAVEVGEIVERDGFVFADVVPSVTGARS